NVPGYTGPEEAVFSPQTLPGASNPSTTTAGVSVSVIADAARAGGKKWLKSTLWGGGGIVVLAGLGLAGYYFVYPLIFPTVPSSPVPVVQPAQPATTTPGTATTTPQAVFEPHKSFFVIAAEKTEALKVTPTDTALSLRAALDGMSRDTAATGTIKEALATKEDGSPESFARVISLLIPELSEATLTTLFRGDFTLAFYFDQNGAWPVYVAQIQLGANLLDTQAALDGFEKSANLANLYPTNPGLQNPAGFKDGNASGKPMRYLSFTKQGASLNYGWIDNFLVIGASYDAVKDAIRRLGLGLRS
ncbi:MAG: hypothetical protein Q8Q41_00075, partial [bacterium]|nr:hypothetical protein [bacterium]